LDRPVACAASAASDTDGACRARSGASFKIIGGPDDDRRAYINFAGRIDSVAFIGNAIAGTGWSTAAYLCPEIDLPGRSSAAVGVPFSF